MDKIDLLLQEIRTMGSRLDAMEATMATKDDIKQIHATMATKDDIKELPYIAQAVLEINRDVTKLLDNHASIYELLGEHEIAIRTLRRKPV